jgi:hypothetical protein
MRRAITIAAVSSLAPLGACGEDKAVTLSKCTQKAIKKKVGWRERGTLKRASVPPVIG